MSNQEAIALLRNLEDSLDSYCELSEEGKTAFRMAIEALSSSEFPNSSDTDTISRQAAIDAVCEYCEYYYNENVIQTIQDLPPAQPEPFTDKEQRIFLAAMGREEKVCKEVDEEYRDCREPYEDSLVKVCREIMRKVKGALWT